MKDILDPPGKSPKAALGIGYGEAAQEIGGGVENLHADFAIGRDFPAVTFAKARADYQIDAPVQRRQDIASLRFGIWEGLVVCMGR